MAKKKQLPAKGSSKGKGSRYDRIVLIGIVIALVTIALTLWGPLGKFTGQKEKKQVVTAKKRSNNPKKMRLMRAGARMCPSQRRKREAVLVAIIIDDLGQDLKLAKEIASLPARITFAVMPGLPNPEKVADLAKQNSREILLHLPMEHRGKNGKPAPGMLRSDMTPMDFLNTLTSDLASVPGAVGVNNHEGSSLTENKEAMKFLMAELKARELFFLDSFTSPDSVGYADGKRIRAESGKARSIPGQRRQSRHPSGSNWKNCPAWRKNAAALSGSAIPIRQPSVNSASGLPLPLNRESRSYPCQNHDSKGCESI